MRDQDTMSDLNRNCEHANEDYYDEINTTGNVDLRSDL